MFRLSKKFLQCVKKVKGKKSAQKIVKHRFSLQTKTAPTITKTQRNISSP